MNIAQNVTPVMDIEIRSNTMFSGDRFDIVYLGVGSDTYAYYEVEDEVGDYADALRKKGHNVRLAHWVFPSDREVTEQPEGFVRWFKEDEDSSEY